MCDRPHGLTGAPRALGLVAAIGTERRGGEPRDLAPITPMASAVQAPHCMPRHSHPATRAHEHFPIDEHDAAVVGWNVGDDETGPAERSFRLHGNNGAR